MPGLFGDQAERLRRRTWGGGELKIAMDEIYTILTSTADIMFNQNVTFGDPNNPDAKKVTFNNPVTNNNQVTNNGPVTNNNTVVNNNPPGEAPAPDTGGGGGDGGGTTPTPTPTPDTSNLAQVFIGRAIRTDGEGTDNATVRVHKGIDFPTPNSDYVTVSVGGLGGMKIPFGCFVHCYKSTEDGNFYGHPQLPIVCYGQVVGAGASASDYFLNLLPGGPDGVSSRTQVAAKVVRARTEKKIANGPVFLAQQFYDEQGVIRWQFQYNTWMLEALG